MDGDTLSVVNLTSSSGTVNNNGNGTFTISAPLNANGLVTLTYDVTDGNGGTVTGQTRTFARAPVNDAPTNISLSGATVQEFRANGTVVGSVSGTDVDSPNLTFSLVNNADGRFTLVGNQIRVANGLLLDYEQAKTHNIVVRVSDGSLTFDKTLTITVGDVNPETIVGDAAANTFVGGALGDSFNGGAGADTLVGGLGNDTYITDGVDTITELASGGTDTIDYRGTATSFSLAALTEIENLTIAASNALSAAGNAKNNTITGNGLANMLNGAIGTDVLIGGLGNDTYVTDGGDVITEGLNAGVDLVRSSATHTLATNVENLTLTGTGAINGTGNTLANVIIGNSAANILAGGLGNDTLTGGLGANSFLFNTALNASTNRDTVTDYNVAADTIRLENLVFTKLVGVNNTLLTANQFWIGTGAHDLDDRIIYNSATGALLYDADGNKAGGLAAVQFATLRTGLALTNAEFLIV